MHKAETGMRKGLVAGLMLLITACGGGAESTGPATGPAREDLWTYDHDANGNLTTLTTAEGVSQYDYDALNRLVRDAGAGQPETTYSYDPNGNRLTRTEAGSTTTLDYTPNSNRLIAIDGDPQARDAAGNLLSDRNGARTYEYNAAGRLWKVYENGQLIATYTYNALGQRVRKDTRAGTTLYHYDLQGRLIAETRLDGTPVRDYLHLEDRPIAQIEIDATGQETITYLHTDHLGTPRVGTDESGVVVWRWKSDAFGNRPPEEDPDGDGVMTEVNLRFAGQYYDGETGFYYNYFRYYDSSTGRYITSDPIGLRGELNTYTYAMNNPLYWTDPYGLYVEVLVGGAHWYDHAAVRIDNTVYSTGRYRVPGRDTGSFGLTGPNVLTVQSANSYYETSDSCNSCNTIGFKLDVSPAEEAKIKKYYQDLIAKSKKHPTRSDWYILPDDYAFVGNNCASTVVDALSSGLPWYQSMSLPGVATPLTLEMNLHMSPFLVDETIHYQSGQ